jgi:seryl-tRNA synthetase
MIDIRAVRDDSASVKAALGRRGIDGTDIDRLVELDADARTAVGDRDELRAQIKVLSRQVGEARRSGDGSEADALTARSRALGDEERALGVAADDAQDLVRETLLYLPNLPSVDAPDGAGPEDNVVVRTWPEQAPAYGDFQRVPHWEVGSELGLLERDDLWAIPTAEVPLTSMWRGDILDEEELPLRLTAATSCFRREAGSAGRDTRGLLRVHEFDKVELFAYATPAQAEALHQHMVAKVEHMLQQLGLQYRVLDLCTGDLGNSAARTFDLEVYAPGVDQWLEVSSVSWFSDYQARRANVRYRPLAGGGPTLVHTLNGSALAWPRIWAALVETGRQADGSVVLPEVLRPYLGAQVVIPAAE